MGDIIFKNSGDDTKGQSNVLIGLISTLAGYNALMWGINLKKKRNKTLSVSDKLIQIRNTNIATNLTLISYVLGRYYIGNTKRIKPAAVLAGVPLGTVEELSHALSDRIVKYRATGGVFLAHQDGGNESLRIVCKAWGNDRYFFLILLDFLFMYGRGKILDLFKNLTANPLGGVNAQLQKTKLTEMAQIANPWKLFDAKNADEGREEYHLTFPIVTKNRIFSSMYLETYDIIESVNTGMNVLTITLFLRKYRTGYPLEIIKITEKKKGKKEPDINYYYRSEKVKKSTIHVKFKKSLRWWDSIMDFGLSLLIMAHKYVMLYEYTHYTPEEMNALSFATHLDKTSGLNTGYNIGISEDNEGNITVDTTIEQTMGIVT